MNPPAEPKKVLIVDDEENIRELLRATFRNSGYTLLFASNGKAAVEIARQEKPAVVILDVVMPGELGWDVLKTLRSEPATQHTKVIIVTALARRSIANLAYTLGADEYLGKPFSPAEALQKVAALLKKN